MILLHRLASVVRWISRRDKAEAELRSELEAFVDMAALERGAIANPDENRMVGHYWLRSPSSAPTPELRTDISDALAQIELSLIHI